MPNKILTADGWEERVRSKFSLTSNQLSDTDIQQPDIIDVAEAMVIDRVPDYADIISAGGSKKVFLESAVVSACAALLCPSMSQRVYNTKGPHMSVDYGDIDWKEKQEKLWEEVNKNIGLCNDNGETPVPSIPFGVYGPTRAGTSWR